jgi:flagellar hook-associated protein 1 FlgK
VSINNISIINNAYSALEIAQAGMTITSQNVSGANVEGFSRRNSNNVIGLMAPSSRDFGSTAFAVEGFTRFVDNLLTKQQLEQRSKTSYSNTLLQAVSGLDSLMMDPASSISVALSKFVNAAGTLANNASSLTNKQTFAGAATELANRVSSFNEYINDIKKSTQVNMTAILNEANTLAPSLQRINQQILASSAPGYSTPSADILDERDRITMRMQDLLGGSTIINEDGTATFQMAGISLVDRMNASQFINTDVSVSDQALFNVFIKNSETGHLIGPLSTYVKPNEGFAATPEQQYLEPKTIFTSGQAGGAFQILADFVPDLQRSVSALTLGIFRDVNSVKKEDGSTTISSVFGYRSSGGGINTTIPTELSQKYQTTSSGSLVVVDGKYLKDNGTPAASSSRVLKIEEIMTASDPTSSFYLSEIAKVVNDQVPNKSYGSSSFVSMLSYGSEVALNFTIDAVAANRIEQLRGSFSNPLSLITGDVASTISSWKNLDKVNQVIGKQLEDRRESISGVNLDEEAANLVKFQQMYGAASKVMQTANQMFNLLLNMLSE